MGRARQVDRSIEVKFLADMKELVAASKATQQTLGGISGASMQFNNVTSAMSEIVRYAQMAFDAFIDLSRAASDYDQAIGKGRAVFGEYFSTIEKFADTSALVWGQSRLQAINYASDIGNVFASLGTAKDAAAAFGVEALQLASDMSAFANLDIEQALTAIRSGLVGETEPLRRFGIVVYDAAVKAKALEMGLWDGKGAMDESAKVTARWALIQERAANMTGSFAREQDTLQVQTQKLNAQIDDLKISLGTGLVPATLEGTKAIRGFLISTSFLVDKMGELGGPNMPKDWWTTTMGPVGPVLKGLKDAGEFFSNVAESADKTAASTAALDEALRKNEESFKANAEQSGKMGKGLSSIVTGMDSLVPVTDAFAKSLKDARFQGNEFLTAMGQMRSAIDQAFAVLDDPTLRQTVKNRWKDLTTKSFTKAIESGNPERKAQAQQAAYLVGQGFQEAGLKYKPTGNPMINEWMKKGYDESKARADALKFLAKMQAFLNNNPLKVLVQQKVTGGGGVGPAGNKPLSVGVGGGAAAATVVNINMGVGDPVAVGREVSRVLGTYSSRVGHI
jgi:hypothetical protein